MRRHRAALPLARGSSSCCRSRWCWRSRSAPTIPNSAPPVELGLSLKSFALLFTDDLYLAAWLSSLRIAATATLVALLLGYPMAYAIARAGRARRPLLLMLVMLPFWTSFLIRVYAWMGLLADNGLLNQLLRWTGLVADPGTILGTDGRSISASSTPTCRSWCCRSTPRWRSSTAACSRRRPISARRRRRLPHRHPAAVAARHRRRLPAGVHPGGRRVRDPRPAGRHRHADDRQGAVGRVLHQLPTGRSPRRWRSACCVLLVGPIVLFQRQQRAA